jgi:hypothetical protein
MSISVDQATRSLGSGLPGDDHTATSVVTITTDNASGYALAATDPSDTAGMDRDGGGDTFDDYTGTNATPTAWAAGTSGTNGMFGMTVLAVTGATTTKLAKWGSGTLPTDFTNNLYAGLRTTDTILHTRTSYFAPADTVTVGWRANPSATTQAGPYTAAVTFTATANP